MVLSESPAVHAEHTLTSTANASGYFENRSFSPEAHDFGVTFTLTATGESSGYRAQTTFTDSHAVTSGGGSSYSVSQFSGSMFSTFTDIGNHCDDCTTLISLPFTYSLYGRAFTQAFISSNGVIQFVSNSAAYSNSCLPNANFDYAIFAKWDDLWTADAGQGIFTSVVGTSPNRIFVIEWRASYFYNRFAFTNFQVRLYEGQQRFEIVYARVDNAGRSATVGVQEGTGLSFTQYQCNGGELFGGLGLNFGPSNTPPVANNDSFIALEDTPLSVAAPGVLGNDTDADSNPLTARLVGNPSFGSVTLTSNGSFTYNPNPNFNGTDTFRYVANDGTVDSNTATVTIAVTAVNDAPSFTKGADQTVAEDAGARTVAGWATSISAGPSNEAAQTLTFAVTGNTNPALFAAAPSVSSSGTLTYTPAADANGSATLTLQLQDNGGTANGGVDTSASQTFTIIVTAVNDAPSFTKGADQTVAEDAGARTVAGWATSISAGPSNEAAQTLTFAVTGNTNPALFAAAPSVSSSGTLTYTPAADANGSATLTLQLQDNGGTANGGVDTSASQTFTIIVTAVNDAPVLANPGNQISLEGDVISLQITASDIDGDTLTYSAAGLAPTLSISSTTGLIAGTLSSNSAGIYPTVTVSVSDGSLLAQVSFQWTVHEQRLFFPLLATDANLFTGFALANVSSVPVTATLQAFDDSGTTIVNTQSFPAALLPVNQNSQVAKLTSEVFLSTESGWFRVSHTQDGGILKGFFLHGRLTTIDGVDVSGRLSTDLVFPLITRGEGESRVILVNPTSAAATLTLELFGPLGSTEPNAAKLLKKENFSLGARSRLEMSASELFEQNISNVFTQDAPAGQLYLRVRSNRGLFGFQTAPERTSSTDFVALRGLDKTSEAASKLVFAHVAEGAGFETLVSVINVGSTPASVTLLLALDDGTQQSVVREIPASGVLRAPLKQLFSVLRSDRVQVGYLEAGAGGASLLGNITFRHNLNGATAALPGQAGTSKTLVFSHVAVQDVAVTSNAWLTGIALLNPSTTNDATVTITVRKADGSVAGVRENFVLKKGERISRLLAELVREVRNQAGGYIVVESSQPLYGFELFGDWHLKKLAAVPAQ